MFIPQVGLVGTRLDWSAFLAQRVSLCLALLVFARPTLASNLVHTPEYVITQWTIDDGLPENSATSIVQTPDGYLWFGTFNGLVRFDGVRFTVFGPNNTPAVPNRGIVRLALDNSGGLWVSTLGGIARLHQGKWESYVQDEAWRTIPLRMLVNPDSSAFVLFNSGHIAHFDGSKSLALPLPPNSATDQSRFLMADAEGAPVVVGRDATYCYKQGRWQALEVPATVRKVLAEANVILRTGNGDWIAGTPAGPVWFTLSGIVRTVPVPFHNGVDISEDPDGTVWLSSDTHGLTRVGRAGPPLELNRASGFPANSLRLSFRDREGNRWVGTNGDGLLRIRRRTFATFGSETGLPELPIKSVAVGPANRLNVGTYGHGLYELSAGKATRLFADRAPAYVQALHTDRKGRLWVGSFIGGLHVVQDGKISHLQQASVCGNTIEAVFEDRDGRIWIGGSASACLIEDGQLRAIPMESAKGPVPIAAFAQSRDGGAIYAGGDGGLYQFNGDRFQPVLDNARNPLPSLRAIAVEDSGSLLLGTGNEGLRRWTGGTLQAPYKPERGVVGIGGIFEDGDSYWLATTRGIDRVNREELRSGVPYPGWQTFSAADGLSTTQCSVGHQPIIVRDNGGAIWIATLKGLARVNPRTLGGNSVEATPLIETVVFRSGNGQQQRREVLGAARIELPSDAWDIRLLYTSPSLASPENVGFDYRIQHGSDTLSAGFTLARELSLLRLPPGDSSLEIRALSSSGRMGKTTAKLSLHRVPYPWENVYVVALGVIVLTGFAIAMMQLAIRRKDRLQQQELQRARAAEESMQLAKQRAEEASRLKTMFLANMSHELRTPMNAILGMTQLLMQSEQRPQEHEMISTVYSSSKALLGLLNDLLDLSRIEAGQLPLKPEDFELTAMLDELITLFTPHAARKSLDLSARIDPPGSMYLRGDVHRLRQILINFLDNAIKFTEAGSVQLEAVRLGGSSNDIRLKFSVIDTGCGIPPARIGELFAIFTQLDNSTTRRHEGTGLGLAITRRLARLMGGDAGVESTPGKGSRFWATVTLAPASPVDEEETRGLIPLTGVRVLVVEDNKVNGFVLQRLLERLECIVTICEDGASAIEHVQGGAVDIVLMDVQMPVMDGLEATRRIRALKSPMAAVPIIAVTASAMVEDRSRCSTAGMNDFLTKPISMEDLSAALARHTPAPM